MKRKFGNSCQKIERPKIPKVQETTQEKQKQRRYIFRDLLLAGQTTKDEEEEEEQITPLPQRTPLKFQIRIPKAKSSRKKDTEDNQVKEYQDLDLQSFKTPRLEKCSYNECVMNRSDESVQKDLEAAAYVAQVTEQYIGRKLEFQSPSKSGKCGSNRSATGQGVGCSKKASKTAEIFSENKQSNENQSSGQSTSTKFLQEFSGQQINVGGISNNKLRNDRHNFRHEVIQVQRGGSSQDVSIIVRNSQGEEFRLQLFDDWASTPVEEGDFINLIFHKDQNDENMYQNQRNTEAELNQINGILVLHPDILVSGTTISDGVQCPRKAVLKQFVSGGSCQKAVEGVIQHELFEFGLSLVKNKQSLTQTVMLEAANEIIENRALEFFEVGMDELGAREVLKQLIPQIISVLSQHANYGAQQLVSGVADSKLQIMQVLDIEENIWAPKYGLKGQLDASLVVRTPKNQNLNITSVWKMSSAGPTEVPDLHSRKNQCWDKIVPFEFKSGKEWYTHQAQVIIYQLLMQERYLQEGLDDGILWYTKNAQLTEVKSNPSLITSLISARNRVAHFLKKQTDRLPPVLAHTKSLEQAEFSCTKCPIQQLCAVSRKCEDTTGNPEYPPKSEILVSDSSAQFLKKWLRLVDLEESMSADKKSLIWKISGCEREQQGGCISNLKLLRSQGQMGDRRYVYLFEQKKLANESTELHFCAGDYGVLSVEGQHPGLMRCHVLNCSKIKSQSATSLQLLLGLYKPLQNSYPVLEDSEKHQKNIHELQWRLDKDEVASYFLIMRQNLYEMVLNKTRLAKIIIDCDPPSTMNKDHDLHGCNLLSDLKVNQQQENVVKTVLGGQEFTLIQGMPGTGKTTTIVQLIRALIKQEKKVLISSYTNSALDNIICRLIDYKIEVLRLGRYDSVHESVQSYVLGQEKFKYASVKDLKEISEKISVVGVTCLSTHHPIIKQVEFDICIMDEASQVNLPTCLGPLLYAKQFVLVGDHYQLPPIVRSPKAEQEGMADSLFKRLYEAHNAIHANTNKSGNACISTSPTVALTHQYRMNESIMKLSSEFIYNNRLVCGSKTVAEQTLQIPNQNLICKQKFWMQTILQESNKVIFVNTDLLRNSYEIQVGDGVYNYTEIQVIKQVLGGLDGCGVNWRQIGILSPFNKQVSSLKENLQQEVKNGVEILTIDKSQGREMDCIIISWVKNNASRDGGILLKDWRRINVAITRARKKLILIGSETTLNSVQLLGRIIQTIQTCQDGYAFIAPNAL